MKKNIKIIAALLAALTVILCLPVNLLALETEIAEDISEEYSSTEALETVEPEENEQESDTPPELTETETDLETETMVFEEIEDEYILPPTSLDNIQMGDITSGDVSLMSTQITASELPDGVYALKNVGNPGMWMSIEQNNSNPGYHVRQLAYENSTYNNNPADSFHRTCLFKISKKPGTTNQYIIRLMLNNRLSFGFSGDEVITKIIDPVDANVADADTFTIKYTTSGYVIRPYGGTSAVCTPTSTTSGANLIKLIPGSAGSRSRWQLYQYTGAHRNGAIISYSGLLGSVGIPVGTIGYMSAKTWSTHIGANTPYMCADSAHEGIIIDTDYDYGTWKMSFEALSPGNVTIKTMILANQTASATYTGIAYFQIIPREGTYYISNFGTEKYIDIEGPSTAENAIIQQWDFSTASQKQWIIEHASDGYVRIKSAYSNKYIGVNSANTSEIKQYSTLNNYTLWKFERTSSGNLKLVCKALSTSLVLAPPSAALGANLTMVTYTDNTDYKDEWILNHILPLSGYEITYNNNNWSTYVESCCNCYAYAINNQVYPGTNYLWYKQQMGYYKGEANMFSQFTEANIYQATLDDFEHYNELFEEDLIFQRIGRYETCPPGTYKVALVVGITTYGLDYHWYRQDADGLWSHKQGVTPVKRTDNAEKIIFDPYTADRGVYTQFLGYYAVSPWNNMFTPGETNYCYYWGDIFEYNFLMDFLEEYYAQSVNTTVNNMRVAKYSNQIVSSEKMNTVYAIKSKLSVQSFITLNKE